MLAKRTIGVGSVLAIASIVVFAGTALAGELEVQKATVCDLLMHRDAFDKKNISVQATFVGGLLEHTGIVDARCKDLGGIAVVNNTDGTAVEDHLVNLANAMQRARVNSTNAQLRTVSAHLIGTFTAGSRSTGGAKLVIRDATAIKIVAWTPVMVPLPRAAR